MSNENLIAEPAIEPADKTAADPAQTLVETPPEPTQEEKAEAEQKAEKRRERRERKEFFEMKGELKAKAEFLEREIQRLQQGKQQSQPQLDENDPDFEAIVEKKLAEREAKKAAESFFNKSKTLLERAAEEGDFDVDEFIPLPRGAADAIVELDNPKLVAYLQKNPEEIQRLSQLSPARQAVEVGKLELKLAAQPTVKKSGAPAPIAPITAKKSGASEYRPDMTDEEYNKWVDAQRKSYKG